MSAKCTVKKNDVECTICNKKAIHNPKLQETGTNIGDSSALATVLMEFKYHSAPASKHPLSTGEGKYCAQAHHLICSESMNNEDWAHICDTFGYNINCKENGIMLPADMRVACQLHIPLHKGCHKKSESHLLDMTYVEGVKGYIDSIFKKAKRKGYCEIAENETIISELNSKSKLIWNNIESFAWTITSDAYDYMDGGIGCSGVERIGKKTSIGCDSSRLHNLNILEETYFLEQKEV